MIDYNFYVILLKNIRWDLMLNLVLKSYLRFCFRWGCKLAWRRHREVVRALSAFGVSYHLVLSRSKYSLYSVSLFSFWLLNYRSPLEVGVDWSITRSPIDQSFDIFTHISPNFDSIGTWCNAPPVTICFLRIKKYHFRFSGHRVRLNALCKFLKPLFRPLHRNSVLRT